MTYLDLAQASFATLVCLCCIETRVIIAASSCLTARSSAYGPRSLFPLDELLFSLHFDSRSVLDWHMLDLSGRGWQLPRGPLVHRVEQSVRSGVARASGRYSETHWYFDDTYHQSAHSWTCVHNARCSYRAWLMTGQREVPFGVFIVVCNDTTIASETCEELFTPDSPSLALGLNGAEIIAVSLIQHRQLMQRF